MKIMKILALIMALCLMLSLAACGGENPTEPSESTEPSSPVTEPSESTEPDDGKVTYTVKVVDEDGAPIAGVGVQLCLETCSAGFTGEDGVATFRREEADYKVSFMGDPPAAGYTYSTEEQEFYFSAGSYEMTITLKAED